MVSIRFLTWTAFRYFVYFVHVWIISLFWAISSVWDHLDGLFFYISEHLLTNLPNEFFSFFLNTNLYFFSCCFPIKSYLFIFFQNKTKYFLCFHRDHSYRFAFDLSFMKKIFFWITKESFWPPHGNLFRSWPSGKDSKNCFFFHFFRNDVIQ